MSSTTGVCIDTLGGEDRIAQPGVVLVHHLLQNRLVEAMRRAVQTESRRRKGSNEVIGKF